MNSPPRIQTDGARLTSVTRLGDHLRIGGRQLLCQFLMRGCGLGAVGIEVPTSLMASNTISGCPPAAPAHCGLNGGAQPIPQDMAAANPMVQDLDVKFRLHQPPHRRAGSVVVAIDGRSRVIR
jgi:hypothetical protein